MAPLTTSVFTLRRFSLSLISRRLVGSARIVSSCTPGEHIQSVVLTAFRGEVVGWRCEQTGQDQARTSLTVATQVTPLRLLALSVAGVLAPRPSSAVAGSEEAWMANSLEELHVGLAALLRALHAETQGEVMVQESQSLVGCAASRAASLSSFALFCVAALPPPDLVSRHQLS